MFEGLEIRMLLARARVYKRIDPHDYNNLKISALENAHYLGRNHARQRNKEMPLMIAQERELADYYSYGVDMEKDFQVLLKCEGCRHQEGLPCPSHG